MIGALQPDGGRPGDLVRIEPGDLVKELPFLVDNVIITGADISDSGRLKSVDAKGKLTMAWGNIKSK